MSSGERVRLLLCNLCTLIQQLVDRLSVVSYEGENTPEGEKLERLRREETRLMERLTDLSVKMDGYPIIAAKPATHKS